MNERMSNEGVCRTTPATPGLLTTCIVLFLQNNWSDIMETAKIK